MEITNEMGLPEPFYNAAKTDYTYTDKRYSVTAILKGIRENILLRRHYDQITVDASENIWAIFGTAVHSILEKAPGTFKQLKEQKIEVPMPNGYVLSGIFDLYDMETKTLTDYKTGTVYKVLMNEWDDYKKQLLGYAYMLDRCGLKTEHAQIIMLLKDHSKSKARHEWGYPPHPVYKKEWKFSKQEIYEFGTELIQIFKEIERCEKLTDEELPICTPEQRWARPEKWALCKKGRKKAIKLYDTREEAEEALSKDSSYYVEHRPGLDAKCMDYCNAREFCSYWKEHYGY